MARDETEALLSASVDQSDFSRCLQWRFVIVTQDCDLVAEEDKEPYVEFIGGCEIPGPDNLHRNGRNPRLLDIEMSAGQWLRISIHNRFRVPKSVVAQLSLDGDVRLDGKLLRLLVDWIAKRYTRAAFPDAFNERVDTADRKLEKLFKSPEGEVVSGMYLDVRGGEEREDDEYRVIIRVTAEEKYFHGEEPSGDLEKFEKNLARILDGCGGISVEDTRCLPESDFTVADLRRFKTLDRDYRSLPEQDGVARPLAPGNAP